MNLNFDNLTVLTTGCTKLVTKYKKFDYLRSEVVDLSKSIATIQKYAHQMTQNDTSAEVIRTCTNDNNHSTP
jgi:hypothetical protein